MLVFSYNKFFSKIAVFVMIFTVIWCRDVRASVDAVKAIGTQIARSLILVKAEKESLDAAEKESLDAADSIVYSTAIFFAEKCMFNLALQKFGLSIYELLFKSPNLGVVEKALASSDNIMKKFNKDTLRWGASIKNLYATQVRAHMISDDMLNAVKQDMKNVDLVPGSLAFYSELVDEISMQKQEGIDLQQQKIVDERNERALRDVCAAAKIAQNNSAFLLDVLKLYAKLFARKDLSFTYSEFKNAQDAANTVVKDKELDKELWDAKRKLFIALLDYHIMLKSTRYFNNLYLSLFNAVRVFAEGGMLPQGDREKSSELYSKLVETIKKNMTIEYVAGRDNTYNIGNTAVGLGLVLATAKTGMKYEELQPDALALFVSLMRSPDLWSYAKGLAYAWSFFKTSIKDMVVGEAIAAVRSFIDQDLRLKPNNLLTMDVAMESFLRSAVEVNNLLDAMTMHAELMTTQEKSAVTRLKGYAEEVLMPKIESMIRTAIAFVQSFVAEKDRSKTRAKMVKKVLAAMDMYADLMTKEEKELLAVLNKAVKILLKEAGTAADSQNALSARKRLEIEKERAVGEEKLKKDEKGIKDLFQRQEEALKKEEERKKAEELKKAEERKVQQRRMRDGSWFNEED